MAKRGTTLSPKTKSRRSRKTKKRLEVKKQMLQAKALKIKKNSHNSGKKRLKTPRLKKR